MPQRDAARRDLADAHTSTAAYERQARGLRSGWWKQLGFMSSDSEPGTKVLHGVFLARIVEASKGGDLTFDWVTGQSNGLGDMSQISNDSDKTFTYPPSQIGPASFLVRDGPWELPVDSFIDRFNAQDSEGQALRDSYWWVTLAYGEYMVVQASR
jgi:hypothetical protein